MPGYGVVDATQGSGLLPWFWAVEHDDLAAIGAFVSELNHKYETDYSVDFFYPTDNACFRVRPGADFCIINCDRCSTIDNDYAYGGTREPLDHLPAGSTS